MNLHSVIKVSVTADKSYDLDIICSLIWN